MLANIYLLLFNSIRFVSFAKHDVHILWDVMLVYKSGIYRQRQFLDECQIKDIDTGIKVFSACLKTFSCVTILKVGLIWSLISYYYLLYSCLPELQHRIFKTVVCNDLNALNVCKYSARSCIWFVQLHARTRARALIYLCKNGASSLIIRIL